MTHISRKIHSLGAITTCPQTRKFSASRLSCGCARKIRRGCGSHKNETYCAVNNPQKNAAPSGEDQGPVQAQGNSDVTIAGGYRRGVFVRAARGSSIDVGLFHDDQRRSVATVEVWVNAGKKVV